MQIRQWLPHPRTPNHQERIGKMDRAISTPSCQERIEKTDKDYFQYQVLIDD